MEAKTVTPKEIKDAATFLARMLPALMQGQTFEQAGRDVLARDEKLFLIATGETDQGALIRKHLAARVFDDANIINHAKRQAMVVADQRRLAALTEIERSGVK